MRGAAPCALTRHALAPLIHHPAPTAPSPQCPTRFLPASYPLPTPFLPPVDRSVAYVEFADAESVVRAMALNGILFMGQPLLVSPSHAEKNRQAQQAKNASAAAKLLGEQAGGGLVPSATKVRVSNLPVAVSEADLRGVLEAFGPLVSVQLAEPTNSAREATVEYAQPADASTAVGQLDGYLLEEACTLRAAFVSVPRPAGAFFAPPLAAALPLPVAPPPPHGVLVPPPVAPPLQAAAEAAAAAAAVLAIQPPTQCMRLRNLFDPDSEAVRAERDFFVDLLDDVREECNGFGKVLDAFVDPRSADGSLHVRFESADACARAAVSMCGRWYSGSQLTASYLSSDAFDAARAVPGIVHV